MPEVPQPIPLRPITPPVLPPTATEFLTHLRMPDPKPSLKNITNSNAYIDQVITHLYSSQKLTLTDDDLSRAIVHHHRLLTAHTMDIKDVKASLVQVKKDLLEKIHGISMNITRVNQKLQAQSKSVVYIAILMAHTYNLSFGDGHDCPYVVVSSPMGRSPAEGDFWTGRNLLPPLECVDDFCALEDAQLDGYIHGYNITFPQQWILCQEKLTLLRYYIGCQANALFTSLPAYLPFYPQQLKSQLWR
ncbi:hypothetical protein EDD18DRAFT_1116448 [Armillaria luteobubalina]|uniref:Mug135-like C-terminal domain-containing protein n=1 Tax=Armillaria luteobubalina TaxID=153913 RepID=A0AA39P001_9AGAR|nr:hypothetical protein EDD18DRAFT_1116448 [Armillaria luteobubalina]